MKFKVGDRVQFKTWEEMKKEFGTNNLGTIECILGFLPEMKFLCGTYATIYGIKGKLIDLTDFTANGSTKLYGYSVDMIKPAKDEKKYRVGDKVQYNGSAYVCEGEYSRKEDTDKYELHIMSDGNKTTAVYKKNGEVVSRSEANLHPDDEFNFKTGAQIAFDRVFQPETEKKEPKKTLRIFDRFDRCYGEVGRPTKYTDINNRQLFVGDIVEIKDFISPKQFVCEDEEGNFICGIKEACNSKFGVVYSWIVRLVTPFSEVKDGTEAGSLTCRLK